MMNEKLAIAIMILIIALITAVLGYQLGTYHGVNEGAVAVYEKSIVCEQALDEWVCKKVDE